MNNNFKATHIIVATSYENPGAYHLKPGEEVILDEGGSFWVDSREWVANVKHCTVKSIEQVSWPAMPEPIEVSEHGQGLYSFDQVQTYARRAVELCTEPIKPASLFTEAQLRELEGIYGLVRVNDLPEDEED